jgi:lipoprotein NlpD
MLIEQNVLTKAVVILLMLTLTACGGSLAVAPIGSYKSKPSSQKPPAVYTVKKGDTLYSIGWRYGMDYKTLASINGIRAPYTIHIGQKLKFKSTRTPAKPSTSTTTTAKAKTTVKQDNYAYSSNKNLTWHWPTEGKVISTFSTSAAGRKGIDIAGRSGQQVIAAASGKVVYSGNGLPRYGNLLIIKHNDSYLSAYAHNKQLLVQEGQAVKGGQKIALLGRTGTQRDQLHFEIRRNGKPVDPLRFLPKR